MTRQEEEKMWLSLWELGQVFGVGVRVVGRWLEARNLVDRRNSPTSEAISSLCCDLKPDWQGIHRWHWNRKLIEELERDGHIRPDRPVLKQRLDLHGPFVARLTQEDAYEMVGGDGRALVRVTGQENAAFVLKLLNMAHKCGQV